MHQELLQQAASHQQKMIDRIIAWSSIPSGSNFPDGLEIMKKTLIEAFSSLQAKLEEIPLENNSGYALLFTKRPQAPVTILLGGHYDTVYGNKIVSPHWTDNKILTGSGVADMKGGLALMLSALEIFESSPHADRLGWQILINPDEETGSSGSAPLWEELAQMHRYGLLFEPSYPDGAWVDERKGSINLRIYVQGRPAHAGRDFSQGRSAIVAIAHLITEIENLNSLFEGISVNVGTLEGGSAINIVADKAGCSVNIRSYEQIHIELATAKIQEMVAKASQKEGIHVKMDIGSERPVKRMDAALEKLYALLKICAEELNLVYQTRASGGCCDGNNLAAAGLPVIDTLGVVGGKIHTPEEYLDVSSLVSRLQCALLLMLKISENDI